MKMLNRKGSLLTVALLVCAAVRQARASVAAAGVGDERPTD